MNKIDQLIKSLEGLKEQLEKNINQSYEGGEPNQVAQSEKSETLELSANGQWSLKKDSANPKLAPKDVKVKQLQHQIDTGTYKPDAGKIADAMLNSSDKPLKKASASPYAPHTIATLSSGGTVVHHPPGFREDGTKHSDNYTIKHPKGDVHVWHDRKVPGGHASYNQHKEESDDGSGFDKHHANHPKIQAHINEGIAAIKEHQKKMHGTVSDAPLQPKR